MARRRWLGLRRVMGCLFTLGFVAPSIFACRPEVPPRFVEHSMAAQDAAIKGDHMEAARQWELASQFADIPHDRDEVVYRRATSLERAGQHDAAAKILRELAQRPGSRQERAAYDLATHALLSAPGDGGVLLEATLVKFPGAGVARGAMDRWLRRLTPEERLTVLDRLSAKVSEPTLSERIVLQRARTYTLLGRWSEALAVYSALSRDYPYPAGQYWDEALLHKAALQTRLGDRKAAMTTLEGMLSYREIANIVGSYERRYATATLMLARFVAFDDWQKAHALLSAFPKEHPTSRELDDALWAAALLARDNGNSALACQDMRVLREADPSSRYVACGSLVCSEPMVTGTTEDTCNGYIAKRRATFEGVIERSAAPYYSGVNEQDGALERQ